MTNESLVRVGTADDLPFLIENDRHVRTDVLEQLVECGRTLVVEGPHDLRGWLRWSLFWDEIPFMNMLFVLDGHRGHGLGSALVEAWESQIAGEGYPVAMTSSLANEDAQRFHRKHGYSDCGALLLPGEAAEIVFRKDLNDVQGLTRGEPQPPA